MSESTTPSSRWNSTEKVSTNVVNAVADAKNVDPTDLPPLARFIDPDALNDLFDPRLSGASRMTGQFSFTMAGYDIVVESADQVTVTPAESNTENHVEE